jgi:outer membrane protein assembly factor BamB
MRQLILCVLLLLSVPAMAQTNSPAKSPAAPDWTAFRGSDGQGTVAGNFPLEWSADSGLAWKTPLPGAGASCPVLWKDRIYLTAYTGFFVPDEPGGNQADLKRHLLCLDRQTGKILWQQAIAARLPEEERIRDHGFAASTPAVDDQHIVCFFGKSGVIAFDHQGKEQWRADVGEKTHGWGSAASPVLWKNLVFINASVESESLVALDVRTGRQVWIADGIKEAWNTPHLVTADGNREELIVACQGTLKAFDPAKGTPLWNCATDITWYMVPSAVSHGGIVYCLGGRSGVAGLAVKAGGSGDVTSSRRLWTSLKGSNVTSPIYHEGHLYFMHENRGVAMCLRADTGEVVYEQRLERAGQVYASALLADGRIYYVTRDGRTFVVKASPEFQLLATNDLRDGSIFNAAPVPDQKHSRLLIRSDKALYAIAAGR